MLFTTTWAARGLPFSPSWGDKWPAHAYQAPESLGFDTWDPSLLAAREMGVGLSSLLGAQTSGPHPGSGGG